MSTAIDDNEFLALEIYSNKKKMILGTLLLFIIAVILTVLFFYVPFMRRIIFIILSVTLVILFIQRVIAIIKNQPVIIVDKDFIVLNDPHARKRKFLREEIESIHSMKKSLGIKFVNQEKRISEERNWWRRSMMKNIAKQQGYAVIIPTGYLEMPQEEITSKMQSITGIPVLPGRHR